MVEDENDMFSQPEFKYRLFKKVLNEHPDKALMIFAVRHPNHTPWENERYLNEYLRLYNDKVSQTLDPYMKEQRYLESCRNSLKAHFNYGMTKGLIWVNNKTGEPATDEELKEIKERFNSPPKTNWFKEE